MADLSIAQLEKKAGRGQSPLFARLAGAYLAEGRAKDALTVCESGLASYPYYVTGHFVKGKALLALNMRTEARREFEWVQGFLPSNPAVVQLLEQVPYAPEETLTAPDTASAVEFVPRTVRRKTEERPSAAPEPLSTFGFEISPEPPAPAQDFGFAAPDTTSFDSLGTFAVPPQTTSSFDAPPSPDFGSPQDASPFSGFSGFGTEPQPPSFDAFGAFGESPAQETSDFTLEGPTSSPSEEESFDQYAARMRAELGGENTVPFDEYLSSSHLQSPQTDPIADLAQKLKSAKRITPAVEAPTPPASLPPVINFASKSVPTVTESETPASTGFVTPTLAEIYAKQGWYDDAIKAYRTLAGNKPADRERFLKRIEELEEMKKQQGT